MEISTSQFGPSGPPKRPAPTPKTQPSSKAPAAPHAEALSQPTAPPSLAEALLPSKLVPVGPDRAAEGQSRAGAEERLRDLSQTVDKANAVLRKNDTRLEFSVGEQTGRVVVRVIDSDSGETVRQIPPEHLIALATRLAELRGLLFDAQG